MHCRVHSDVTAAAAATAVAAAAHWGQAALHDKICLHAHKTNSNAEQAGAAQAIVSSKVRKHLARAQSRRRIYGAPPPAFRRSCARAGKGRVGGVWREEDVWKRPEHAAEGRGFEVWGLRFGAWGLRFEGLRFGVSGLEFEV